MEAPLNAVLDERAMAGYDRLFHHLWQLKRVEAAITQGWMRVTSASRAFETLPSEASQSAPADIRPQQRLALMPHSPG